MAMSINQAGINSLSCQINDIGIATGITLHADIIPNINDFIAKYGHGLCGRIIFIDRIDSTILKNDISVLTALGK